MSKRWTAFKRNLEGSIEAINLDGCRAVFHKIEITETEVITPDGSMVAVHIRNKVDLCDPSNDIAVLVGKVKVLRKSGILDPQSPEIWFWDDRFWLKAVDSGGVDYYHSSKAYLLYEIEVKNQDEFLGRLTHLWS